MEDPSNVAQHNIVFDGTKRIFLKDNLRIKSQILINVLIIEHDIHHCFEVITKYKESIVRMYLNSRVLKTMLDTNAIKETFKIKCRILEEQRHSFDNREVMKDIITKMIVTMIRDRLDISNDYKVQLLAATTDKTIVHYCHLTDNCETRLEFEILEVPEGLTPYDITNHTTFYPGAGWSASPSAYPFPRSLRAYSREVNVIRTSSSDSGGTSVESSPSSSFYDLKGDDKALSPHSRENLFATRPDRCMKTDSRGSSGDIDSRNNSLTDGSDLGLNIDTSCSFD